MLIPNKTRAASFLNGFKTFLEKRVSREFITMMLLLTLEISIREKHLTLQTNKEEVLSVFKTAAHDVLSTI